MSALPAWRPLKGLPALHHDSDGMRDLFNAAKRVPAEAHTAETVTRAAEHWARRR